jgi:hypothetical protein
MIHGCIKLLPPSGSWMTVSRLVTLEFRYLARLFNVNAVCLTHKISFALGLFLQQVPRAFIIVMVNFIVSGIRPQFSTTTNIRL